MIRKKDPSLTNYTPSAFEIMDREKLIPLHGGYRKLKSFQVALGGKAEGGRRKAEMVRRFCDRYIDPRTKGSVPE